MSPPSPSTPSSADMDKLRSTWPHRAWTLAGSAAILSSLLTTARLVAASTTAAEPFAVAVAVFAAYSLADLTSGVYHWFIDNYGGAATPVIGAQVAAFEDHHRHPYAITLLEPCNSLHVLAGAVAVALPAAGAAISARGGSPSAAAHAFAGAFAACVMLSVQFHAWAHEKPSKLPPVVAALQDAGVLVSRSEHAGHHRPPHDSNYCTVSGMWNGVLDRYKVFRAMEKVIYLGTGVQPRSWNGVDGPRLR